MMSWAQRAIGQKSKITTPSASLASFWDSVDLNIASALRRSKQIDDRELDQALYNITLEEADIQALAGPYTLHDLPAPCAFVHRYGNLGRTRRSTKESTAD